MIGSATQLIKTYAQARGSSVNAKDIRHTGYTESRVHTWNGIQHVIQHSHPMPRKPQAPPVAYMTNELWLAVGVLWLQ